MTKYNKEVRLRATRKYRATHRDEVLAKRRVYDRERYKKMMAADPEGTRAKCMEWRRANRDAIVAKRRERWRADTEFRNSSLARMRAWVEANPEKHKLGQRRMRLRREYKITEEDLLVLAKRCNNACAICGITEKLKIDHSHTTGTVRGLLCQRCNTGIGMFLESPALMSKAILYIQNFS